MEIIDVVTNIFDIVQNIQQFLVNISNWFGGFLTSAITFISQSYSICNDFVSTVQSHGLNPFCLGLISTSLSLGFVRFIRRG